MKFPDDLTILTIEELISLASHCELNIQQGDLRAMAGWSERFQEILKEARRRDASDIQTQTLSMESVLAEVYEWQKVTFPQATNESKSAHLLSEAKELASNPTDTEEMADVMMLLSGLALGQGVNLAEVVKAKLAKNRLRAWGEPNSEGYVEHVRESASLDTPDSPGWWTFDGHMYWSPSDRIQAVVHVRDIGGGELSPAILVWGETPKSSREIVSVRYRYPSVFVGKWEKINLPWTDYMQTELISRNDHHWQSYRPWGTWGKPE